MEFFSLTVPSPSLMSNQKQFPARDNTIWPIQTPTPRAIYYDKKTLHLVKRRLLIFSEKLKQCDFGETLKTGDAFHSKEPTAVRRTPI